MHWPTSVFFLPSKSNPLALLGLQADRRLANFLAARYATVQ
jgi:hypothetical protein